MDAPVVQINEQPLLAPQRLVPSFLSGEHEWGTEPEVQPSFYTYVEVNTAPRVDMARYKTISLNDTTAAKRAWAKMCGTRTLFRVPETIKCDRTFTRDAEEAYYVDAMDTFLRGLPEHLTIADTPLVRRSFRERLFYRFGRRGGYFAELYERRRVGRWVPFDAYENMHSSDVDLCERYPTADGSVQEIDQPPALPVPAPFVAYYYHTELQKAQRDRAQGTAISERARRLLFSLDHEYPALFIAQWWNEATHGGRQFVFTQRTIETLTTRCSLLPVNMELKPVQVILEYMRTATSRSTNLHCWLAFNDNWMEESTYIWANKVSGEHDPEARPVRRTFWVEKEKGRITLTEHSTRLYKRSTILEKTIAYPDMEKIPGLLDLVRAQNWDLHGDTRVGDLLVYMLQLYTATKGIVDVFMRQGVSGNRSDYLPHERNVGSAPEYRRVGYYNDDYADRERRSYTPPPQYDDHRNYYQDYNRGGLGNRNGNRGGFYRDLDGEAAARYGQAPDLEPRARPRSPSYTRERVYELPDNTPDAHRRYQNSAGPSSPRQHAPYDGGPGPSTVQGAARELQANRSHDVTRQALNNAQRLTQRLPERPPQRSAWADSLFESARKDLQRPPAANNEFRPSTPFMDTGSRGRTPRNKPGQASQNSATGNDTYTAPETACDTEFTKRSSGNLSWGVLKKRTSEDEADKPPDGQARKKARMESEEITGNKDIRTAARPSGAQRREEDPVISNVYARHPSNTADAIASLIRAKKKDHD